MKVLSVIAMAVLLVGCSRLGGKARPAKVEVEWPDAGSQPVYEDEHPGDEGEAAGEGADADDDLEW